MRVTPLLVVLVLLAGFIFAADNKITFSVTVLDSDGKRVDSAAVTVYDYSDDSTIIKKETTSTGVVFFQDKEVPDNKQFYFSATKGDKTYFDYSDESGQRITMNKQFAFVDTGNKKDGFCKYVDGLRYKCQITSHTLKEASYRFFGKSAWDLLGVHSLSGKVEWFNSRSKNKVKSILSLISDFFGQTN
ncbi:hypothetical protein HYT84_03005 [Candidatus Micrarchaeota archaeon]|nr:hypothetical protein [Candidatus Micrarchaeota archaeon]